MEGEAHEGNIASVGPAVCGKGQPGQLRLDKVDDRDDVHLHLSGKQSHMSGDGNMTSDRDFDVCCPNKLFF